MTDASAPFILFAFGLVIGSFLNVCIHRLPLDLSVVWPGSHCTTCDRALAWYENIPVASWVALRGRCRTCGSRISAIYPAVEIVTGALFVGAFYAYGLTPLLFVRILFLCALVVLFAIDYEHQILPDSITVPGIAIGFLSSVALAPGWISSLVGLLAGGVFPFIVARAYLYIRKREGMGQGDFKMLAMTGAFLGWPLVWVVLILACALGIVIGGGALLISKRGLATRIPFGTFIAAAAVVCVLWEVPVVTSYYRTVDAYLEWSGLDR